MDNTQNNEITISVILTCYNEGRDLLRALQSLESQTYKDFEIIIVKDFSDHVITIETCKGLEDKGYKVLWLSENKGLSCSRNLGIKEASGSIIVCLDADDVLPNTSIKTIVDNFAVGTDVLFGNYYIGDSFVDCSVIADVSNHLNKELALKNWLVLGTSPFTKRIWEQIGGYNQKYSYTCQDFDFFVRCLKSQSTFCYVNSVIYKWNRNSSGMNNSLANSKAIDECVFEHLDFLAPYLSHKYVLQLCKQFNDGEQFRFYFRQYTDGIKRYLSCVPFFILRKMIRFVS